MAYLRSKLSLSLVALCAVALFWGLATDADAKRAKGKTPTKVKRKRATGALAGPVNVPRSIKKLRSARVKTARRAAIALGSTTAPAARKALLDALAMGLHPKVATQALLSLGKHRNGAAFSVVSYYARYRDARVRAAAIAALGMLKDARAHGLVLAAVRDGDKSVRAAAAQAIATNDLKQGIELLLALLKKGDEGAVKPLGQMATPQVALLVGELIGVAPNGLVARALGAILLNPKFGPDKARVQVVGSLAKLPGTDAVEQLTLYVDKVPAKPPRKSRKQAEAVIDQKLGEN